MCRMSLLVILFLIGFLRRDSIHAEINVNERELSLSDFGLNQKQFDQIKIVVTNVLKNYVSAPNNLFLRKDSGQLTPLDLNVKFISNVIFDEAKHFFHNLGLINSNKKNARKSLAKIGQFNITPPTTVRESIIHELFAFVHKFIPIGEGISSSIENHLHKNGYRQRGYLRTQLSLPKKMTQNSPYILRLVTYADKIDFSLEAYLYCLNTTTPFDLAHAFAKLVRYPPQITKKIVTSRLSKPIPDNPNANEHRVNDIIAMTCRILVENPFREDFENCLKQVIIVNQCVQDLSDKHVAASTLSNLQSNKQLAHNINILNTTCEVIRNTSCMKINCKNHNYRNFDISLLSLIEKIFGKSFMTSAASRNIVRKFENLIMKSEWSSDMIQEMNNLVEIYREAEKKDQYLLRRSKNNPRALREYDTYSRQLAQYTKNLAGIAMDIVGHVRGITSTVGEALVQTVSTALGFDLSNNFRAMRCFGTFWHDFGAFLDLYFNQTIIPQSYIQQDNFGANRLVMKDNDQNLTGNNLQRAFDFSLFFNQDWLTSMQSIVRTSTHRKLSTIMKMANTFLLATMFYEFIVILAGVIFRTENKEATTTQSTYPANHLPNSDDSEYFDFGIDDLKSMHRQKRVHHGPWKIL